MDCQDIGSREKQPGLFVIVGGLATTAVSLFLVFLVGAMTDGIEPMGFYIEYIIPAGAIIVGLIAGSGYGITSWLSGARIGKTLLWAIVFLQIVSYFTAQYIEYYNLSPCYEDGTPVGFVEYYDVMARSFAWEQEDGSAGDPLGGWGYAFRLLEIAGFVIGGLIAPLALFKKPYCANCQIYKKTRTLCLIPAGVKPRKIRKEDTKGQAAYEAEIDKAMKEGDDILSQIKTMVEEGRASDFNKLIRLLNDRTKETVGLTSRVSLGIIYCKRCNQAEITVTIHTGQGDNTEMIPLDPFTLPPEFVKRMEP